MKRREFITLLGGVAAAGPLAARAQRADVVRRVGVLAAYREDDPEAQTCIAVFRKGLQALGWTEGRNIVMEYRWGAGEPERARIFAAEMVSIKPDVILAHGTPAVTALRIATSTIPVVFVSVIDPVGAGHVQSLARPGEILPVSARLSPTSEANGWNYSKRSRPGCAGWRPFRTLGSRDLPEYGEPSRR